MTQRNSARHKSRRQAGRQVGEKWEAIETRLGGNGANQGDNGQWGNNRKSMGDNLEDKRERSGRQAAQK